MKQIRNKLKANWYLSCIIIFLTFPPMQGGGTLHAHHFINNMLIQVYRKQKKQKALFCFFFEVTPQKTMNA